MSNGECPKAFKVGIIKPIYKNCANELTLIIGIFITLISNVAKIFEKVLKSGRVCFLDKYHK